GERKFLKETCHGTLGTSKHFNPREHQRPGRPRGRSGENDQASDPRRGKPVFAGQNPSGGFYCGSAHAGKEPEGERRERAGVDAQSGTGGRQGAGRPGARGVGPLPDFAAAGAELPRTNRRPEGASRDVERSARETGTETR